MSDERRRKSWLRSKIFWLFLYVIAYLLLRAKGEVAVQQIALPAPGGGVEVFRMVGAHPDLPHWRQQLWRALFSFAMVGEEEGKKFLDKNNRGGSSGGAGGSYDNSVSGVVDGAERMWEDAKRYVRDAFSGSGNR